MYRDFLPIIIFTVLAIALVALPLFIQYIVSPRHNKNDDKQMSYECGEVPEGSAWVKFNVRFYVIALIFIIFDVEVIFLFPWAVIFQDLSANGFGFLALSVSEFLPLVTLSWMIWLTLNISALATMILIPALAVTLTGVFKLAPKQT